MKLLFVHGTKFKENEDGDYYTGGSYNQDVWNRYMAISDKLSVIARKEPFIYSKEYATNSFNYFDRTRMDFIEVPDLNSSIMSFLSSKRRQDRNELIRTAVQETDYLIARLPSEEGYEAVKNARRYQKPYLVEVVGCPWDALWNHSLKGKILAPYSYLTLRKIVKDAPYVVYVTNRFLQRRYPANGKSIGCSNVLLEGSDRDVIGRRLERIARTNDHSKLIIGTTGAVHVKYKGQERVIKALAKLKGEGATNFEYQLVGGGDQSYLRTLAAKHGVIDWIKFMGTMPHEQIFGWLDSIDIYAQPSKTEGLPRALIEALSRGLPAFGARTGGIPELLDDDYVFSNTKRSIDEIVGILKRLRNPDTLKQTAERNFYESQKYMSVKIEARRRAFLNDFIHCSSGASC